MTTLEMRELHRERERERQREREREMPNVYIIFLLNFWLKAEMCIDGMIFFEA